MTSSLALFLAWFLLLAPKINLVRFQSTTIGLKPEDLLVPVVLAVVLVVMLVARIAWTRVTVALATVAALALAYLLLVTVVTLWYAGNLLFVGRYALYFGMLAFACLPIADSRKLSRHVEILAVIAIAFHLILAFLQKTGRAGGFLLGDFTPVASDRVNAVFSNAVEFGGVSAFLLGLVVGGRMAPTVKAATLVAVIAVNMLAQNRVALVAVAIVLLAHALRVIGKVVVTWNGKGLMKVRRLQVAAALLLLVTTMPAIFRGLPRFETLYARENLRYARNYLAQHLRADAEIIDIEARLGGERADVDESFAMRVQRWTYALSLVASGYVAGVGAGNVGQGMDGFLFRVLGETGLPGVLLYSIMLGLILVVVWAPAPFLPGLRYAYLTLLVHALVFDIFYFSRIGYLFWLLIALRLASARNVPKTSSIPATVQ